MKRISMSLAAVFGVCLVFTAIASAGNLEDALLQEVSWCGGSLAGVEHYVGKGANVNARDGMGQTALIRAARVTGCDLAAVVRFLIDKGADVNAYDKNGMTPLALAVHGGNAGIVRALLEKGADANAKFDMSMWNTGWTALLASVDAGPNPDIVRMLIDKGADVKVKEKNGRTALALVDEKIRRGRTGLNSRGDVVLTPLTPAEKGNYEEIAQMLRRAGAR